MKNTLIKYLPWLFILIMIEPSFQRSTLPIFPAVVTFTFHTLFVILAITIWNEGRFPYSHLLNILMLWIFICIIRGIFVSGNYWEYKSLYRYSLALLSSLGILVFMSPYRVIHCLRMYFKYIVPISVVALPFFHTWSWFWMYYVFFVMIIFYPIIYRKNLFLAITIFFTFIDVTARSIFIKVIMALGLSQLTRVSAHLKDYVYKILGYGLYILTLCLLILGLSGVFNVFDMKSYMPNAIAKNKELSQDTRTWLYREAITSAIVNDYVIMGRTPAKGYDSNYNKLKDDIRERSRISGDNVQDLNMERNAEVFFLNVFTWTGLIGVVLFSLMFLMATHIALKTARNDFVKIIGVYVAFRFMYGWVEETFTFNGNILCLWLVVGICYSPHFRAMTNREIAKFFRHAILLPYVR